MKCQLIVSINIIVLQLFCSISLWAASLDGTSSIVFQDSHYVLHNSDLAQGFVRLNNGFTILSGETATFDILVSVSGDIDLRTRGELQLIGDLLLDSAVTLTRAGYIKGRGNVLSLNGDLSIPASGALRITGDTIIDGGGHTLTLAAHAQIVVDNNVTLTLRNMTVKNTRNDVLQPWIQLATSRSKLALDEVEFALNNDFDFNQGQIYIHNDVAITGTHAFIYHSTQPSFVAPASTWYFDMNTSFSFAPPSTVTTNLIKLQASNSAFQMRGCSVCMTGGSLQFDTGKLILEGEISAHRYAYQSLSTLSTLTSVDYGVTSSVLALAWHPQNKILAVGGAIAASGLGGFANTHEVRLYSFNGSELSSLTSQGYGIKVYTLAWSPDGKFLAVGGTVPTNGAGGFSNTDEMRVYSFDGSTLTPLISKDFGSYIVSLAWSPDGKILAVGGIDAVNGAGGFSNTDQVRFYTFDGVSLTPLTSFSYGFEVYRISWHPSGQYFAVAGSGAVNGAGGFANTDELRVYQFDGVNFSPFWSSPYGSWMHGLAWSPDGSLLAVGGNNPTSTAEFSNSDELRVYLFDGVTFSGLTSKAYGENINDIAWHPSGRFLAITGSNPDMNAGGFDNEYETRVYTFDGTDLTATTSQDYGVAGFSVAWDKTGSVLSVAGSMPFNGAGGFNNTDDIRLYHAELYNSYSPARYARTTRYGNCCSGRGSL